MQEYFAYIVLMIVIMSQGDCHTYNLLQLKKPHNFSSLNSRCFMLILSQMLRGYKMWIWQKSGRTRRVTALTRMRVHFRNSLFGLVN